MDYIHIYDNVLTNEECTLLINIFNSTPQKNGSVLTDDGINIIKENTKKCLTSNYSFDSLDENYQKKISNYIQLYMNTYKYIPYYGSIQLTFKKYIKNEGFHKRHVDVNTIYSSRRFLAFILYLNTIDIGGETIFYCMGTKEIKPIEGRLIIFPPFWLYEHEGKIPISDDKYIITGFLNYEILER